MSHDAPSDDDECCSICLDPLRAKHCTTLHGCAHRFHSDCVVVALQHNRACPLCRYAPSLEDPSAAETSPPASPVIPHREHRIRSMIMRARHGSLSEALRASVQRYRTLGSELRDARASMRTIDREVRTVRRAYVEDLQKVARVHRRASHTANRRWWASRHALDAIEAEREELGNIIAIEAVAT